MDIYRVNGNSDIRTSESADFLFGDSGRPHLVFSSGLISTVTVKIENAFARVSGNLAHTHRIRIVLCRDREDIVTIGNTTMYVGLTSYTQGFSETFNVSGISSQLSGQYFDSIKVYNESSYTVNGEHNAAFKVCSQKKVGSIDYSFASTPTAPYSLSLNPNSGYSGTSTTLSWAEPSNGGSAITSYKVYQGTSHISSPTGRSVSLQPTGNAGTITYYVSAVNAAGEGPKSSGASFTINARPVVNAGTAPTSVTINGHSPAYTGANGAGALTLSWNGAGKGTGTITGYHIYKNGAYSQAVSTSETYGSCSISGTGTYTVYTLCSSGNSGPSAGVVWNALATPAKPPAITSGPSRTNGNFTISWTAPTLPTGASSLQYIIHAKKSSGAWGYLTTTTTASYTYNISSLNTGELIQFRVYTRAYAQDGGYTDGSAYAETTATLRYGNMSAPTTSFSKCYDPDSNVNQNELQSWAYTKLKFTWNTATSQSGGTVTYTPKFQISGGAWQTLTAESGNTVTMDLNTLRIAEGATFNITVEATDGSSTTQYTARSITRLRRPSLTTITCSANAFKKATAGFYWGLNNATNLDITYRIDLLYSSQQIATTTGTLNTSSQPSVNAIIDTPLAKNSEIYKAVITNKNPKPTGTCRVTLTISNYPKCTISDDTTFQYNYLNPSASISAPTISSLKTFYNPTDIVTFSFTAVNWVDADGGTTGADVTYRLTAGNQVTINAIPGKSYTNSYGTTATSDMNYTITVTATIKYSNGDSTTATNSVSVRIARWTQDYFALQQVKQNGQVVTGYLLLPNTHPCASGTYANYKSIKYELLNYSTGKSYYTKTETTLTNSQLNFSFNTSDSNFSLYAKITCTNSSNQTIQITTTNYVLYSSTAVLSLRDGRVGINTGTSFTKDSGSSTLEIHDNDSSQTDGTVNIIAPVQEYKHFVDFTAGDQVIGNIQQMNLERDTLIGIKGIVRVQNRSLSMPAKTDVASTNTRYDLSIDNDVDYDNCLNIVTLANYSLDRKYIEENLLFSHLYTYTDVDGSKKLRLGFYILKPATEDIIITIKITSYMLMDK